MPLYLLEANYTPDGTKGLLKEGGTKRRAAVQQMVEKAGGKIHSFYYAFGKVDLYIIMELPDHAAAAALSLTVGASGAASARTTVLMTAEEMDGVVKKPVVYRAPGS